MIDGWMDGWRVGGVPTPTSDAIKDSPSCPFPRSPGVPRSHLPPGVCPGALPVAHSGQAGAAGSRRLLAAGGTGSPPPSGSGSRCGTLWGHGALSGDSIPHSQSPGTDPALLPSSHNPNRKSRGQPELPSGPLRSPPLYPWT